jgi:hypothetical protein
MNKGLLIILLLSCCSMYGQDKIYCKLLNTLLKSRDAKATFKLDRGQNRSIFIIDAKGYFNGCVIDSIYGKSVNVLKDTSGIDDAKKRNIVIYKVIKIKNKYRIEIHQKYTGAYGFVEFKNTKGKVILSKFSIGYF